jgi:non-ribosomal peptide synthetase-like protein
MRITTPPFYDGGPAAPSRTLAQIFRSTFSSYANEPALDDGVSIVTYGELESRIRDLHRHFVELGVGPGERVGIRRRSGTVELYVAIAATLLSGAAYVPVDADDGEERAKYVFDAADVAIVLDDHGVQTRRSGHSQPRDPQPDDEAWVIFTSGSTGRPKGVSIHHRAAANLVDAEYELYGSSQPLGPGDRVAAGLSVAFDASVEEMWLAWRSGACLVPLTKADMRSGPDVVEVIRRRRITALSTVPSLLMSITDELPAHLRLVILGGEACPDVLVQKIAGGSREVWNTYGPTEATVIVCGERLAPDRPVTLGRPIAGLRLAVVDADGRIVEDDGEGELVISGAGLGHYLIDPEQSPFRALEPLGWTRAYFTGDIVRVTRGELFYLGRRDDQVKIAGRRIELAEVERVARQIPGVRDSAAAVHKDEDDSPVLVCYVVADESVTSSTIRAGLQRGLPGGVVARVGRLPALPLSTAGKVQRSALPWPLEPEALASFSDSLHQRIAETWREVLGPIALDTSSNFFEVGGDSTRAARVVVRLRTHFPAVAVADLYHAPRLDEFATLLTSREVPTEEEASREVRTRGHRQALFSFLAQNVAALWWVGGVIGFNRLVTGHGLGSHWELSQALLLTAIFVTLPGRLLVAALIVRLLTVRLRPGRYRFGGWTHIRLWCAERVEGVLGVAVASGTAWMNLYAAFLGCDVGPGVTLLSPPPASGLLLIGAHSVVESEVDLSGWSVQGDDIVVDWIRIGNMARIGTRSVLPEGVFIGDGSLVEPFSTVVDDVARGVRVAGAPAHEEGPAPLITENPRSLMWRLAYMAAASIPTLPVIVTTVADLWIFALTGPTHEHHLGHLFSWGVRWAPGLAILSLAIYAATLSLIVRIAGRFATPGVHSVRSAAGLASWIIDVTVDRARVLAFPIYGTMAASWWMGALGMRVGPGCEVATVHGQIHLVDVGAESFLADDAVLAPREVLGGHIRLGAVRIERRAFVGNSALVQGGTTLSTGSLVGVSTVAPRRGEPETSYFGVPAREFARSASTAAEESTYRPTQRVRHQRAWVEVTRIVPLIMSIVLAEFTFLLTLRVSDILGFLAVPVVALVLYSMALIAAGVTVGAKWLLVGRVKPGAHSLWTPFVWRNELAWCFIESLALPWFEPTLLATPWFNSLFRALGADIGKGVWLETRYLDEPDLVTIGDGAVISRFADLQTHLFHDRVLRLGPISVGAGSVIGSRTFVLPDARIGDGVVVHAGSLVPRTEDLPDHSSWRGIPVEAAHARILS